jgi:hypothetical protein
MKRYTLSRLFLSILQDNDVVIVAGKGLCEEAFRYDKKNYFYIEKSNGVASSVALGIAMHTDKRVFVLCSDGDFLKEMGSAPQMAVSGCNNIFYVIFDEGIYSDDGDSPTIFRSIPSVMGMLFDFGFGVSNYTNFFYKKDSIKHVGHTLDRTKGPRAILIDISKGSKEFDEVSYSEIELKNRISDFICDVDLGTSISTY